jgi:hypothetical protein
MKSKILKVSEEGRIEMNIKTWQELERLVKGKEVDFAEFALAREYLRRAHGPKGEPDWQSLEMLYRALGVESEFSDAVFKSLANADMRGPRTKGKAPNTKKLLAGLDGWKIRDGMNLVFKRVVDAVKSVKIDGELGQELLDGLLHGVNEYHAMWQKKTEDVPEQYSAPFGFEPYKDVAIENRQRRVRFREPLPEDEANFPFRALLALLSYQTWDAMLELTSVTVDLGRIEPEDIRVGFAPPEPTETHRMYSEEMINKTRPLKGKYTTTQAAEIRDGVAKLRAKMAAMDAAPDGLKQRAAEMVAKASKKKGR